MAITPTLENFTDQPGLPIDYSAPLSQILEEMPARRDVLLGILSFCATPRSEAEVAARVTALQATSSSVFDASSLCNLLKLTGAIRLETSDGIPADSIDTAPEVKLGEDTAYLIIHQLPTMCWHTTEIGLEALDSDDPAGHLISILEEDLAYAPIYRHVLELCNRAGGASTRELGSGIDGNPLLQEPRLFVQHFLERLESCHALTWDGSWHTTALGRAAQRALEKDGEIGRDLILQAHIQLTVPVDALDNMAPSPVIADAIDTKAKPHEGLVSNPSCGATDVTSTAPSSLSDVMILRGSTYALLARLFRCEIDQELLEQLRGMRFPAQTGSDEIDAGWRLIATYLSGPHPGVLTDLAVDYVRTFIGHGVDAHSAAYPFESAYTSEKRLLMQQARDEVLALYRAAGFEKSQDWHESEDHIACELEYLSALARRTAQALDTGNEYKAERLLVSQLAFLDDHLLAWAPHLVNDMSRFSRTDFYRGLGCLTRGYLSSDRELLEELLSGGPDGKTDVA